MPVSYPGFKGGDRTNIDLPQVQRNCLKALKAAGKKVVFVNCSGSAIALTPETASCDAILQAWYGGESGGQAVADVLFGDFNPSGKLPVTFYKNSEQLPDIEDYSMKGRTYRFMDDALFPFGYGLSYTRFEIGRAVASNLQVKQDETITLSVPVANKGSRTGSEVVQVYVHRAGETTGALKTLRAFVKTEVAAGKTQTVQIKIPYSAFEFYNAAKTKVMVTPGEYELWYGNSSAAKDLQMIIITVQ